MAVEVSRRVEGRPLRFGHVCNKTCPHCVNEGRLDLTFWSIFTYLRCGAENERRKQSESTSTKTAKIQMKN